MANINVNGDNGVNGVDDDGVSSCCPICFGGCDDDLNDDNLKRLVHGNCGHSCCLQCFRRVFAQRHHHHHQEQQQDRPEDSTTTSSSTSLMWERLLDLPTKGRCPICRSILDVLDLRYTNTTATTSSSTTTTTPTTINATNTATATPTPDDEEELVEEYVYPRKNNRSYTADDDEYYEQHHDDDDNQQFVNGKIFVLHKRRVGDWSIHFPPPPNQIQQTTASSTRGTVAAAHVTNNNNNDNNGTIEIGSSTSSSTEKEDSLPSSSQQPPSSRRRPFLRVPNNSILLDDGTTWVQNTDIPFRYVRYDVHSSTFYGTILWKDGVVVPTGGDAAASDAAASAAGGGGTAADSTASTDDDQYQLRGSKRWDYILTFSSGFRYVSHGVIIQRRNVHVPSHLVLERQELPIQIISFGTTRTSSSSSPFESSSSSSSSSFYHLYDENDTDTNNGSSLVHQTPTYNAESLWGNVFCQVLTVGMASYHFVANNTEESPSSLSSSSSSGGCAYISYEHQRTSVWPNLDNGRSIPSKIYFTETSWDEQHNIFRGKIDWEQSQNTTWNGSKWWKYEIHFATDFSCIIGGTVHAQQTYNDDVEEMSTFGTDLIYLNCGLLEALKASELSSSLSSVANTVDGITSTSYLVDRLYRSVPIRPVDRMEDGSDDSRREGGRRSSRRSVASDLTDRLRSIRRQMEAISSPPESIDRLQALFVLAQSRDISYPAHR